VADAAVGAVAGKGAGEQSLARKLYRMLEDDWLLIADRNFFNWADWCTAADTGAQLLWRVKADLTLPVLAILPDGSYSSVLVNPKIRGKARKTLLEAARGGEDLDEDLARYVRVAGYEVPDRDGDGKGEVIALATTITGMTAAPAPLPPSWLTSPAKAPQPPAPAPDLPEGHQTSPPQLLPRQTARRPRHPPQRPGHDQAGQPAPARTRSMISLCWAAIVLRAVRSRAAER
jgi:hypothetical protein